MVKQKQWVWPGFWQVLLISTFAPFGLVFVALPNVLRQIWAYPGEWTWVWAVPLVLTALSDIVRQDWSLITTTLVSGFFFWLVGLSTHLPRRFVFAGGIQFGFCAALFLILVSVFVENSIEANAWFHPDPRVVSRPNFFAGDQWRFQGLPHGDFVRRSWSLSAVQRRVDFGLEFRAPLLPTVGWVASDLKFQLQSMLENGQSFTRVKTPKGVDPFLSWSFETGTPLAGREFRVSLEMRAQSEIMPVGCRGLWLQEDGGDYASRCKAVQLGSEWRAIDLSWIPPINTKSPSRLRVILNDFDGLSFDVRGLRLEERKGLSWMPISDQWLSVSTPLGYSDRVWLKPTSSWQTANLSLDLPDLHGESVLEAIVWVGAGTLEVRDVVVQGSEGPLLPRATLHRAMLWFGQPNLLGHSVAVILLCGLALSRRGWLSLAMSVVGLGIVFLSGSRTALIAAIFGIPFLIVQRLSFKARIAVLGISCVLIVGFAFFSPSLQRDGVSILNDGNISPRTDIWQVAWRALSIHPAGLGAGRFPAFFDQQLGSIRHEAVQHAHNFWLELAVRYGFFGIGAAVWISLGFMIVSWRRAQWTGLTLVIAIFMMNLFDYTFLYNGVFFPLVLTLNAFQYSTVESQEIV
jgi:O-Antigen ligase